MSLCQKCKKVPAGHSTGECTICRTCKCLVCNIKVVWRNIEVKDTPLCKKHVHLRPAYKSGKRKVA